MPTAVQRWQVIAVAMVVVAAGGTALLWYESPDDNNTYSEVPELTLLSPVNGSRVPTTGTGLAWNISGGDELTALRLRVNSALVAELSPQTCNYTLGPLTAGSRMNWSLEAVWEGDVTYSALWYFTVNRPPAVTGFHPANGSTINTTTPLLEWEASDGDGDMLIYTLEIVTASEFFIATNRTRATTWSATNLTPGGDYKWRVITEDDLDTTVSTWNRFEVDFTEPALELMAELNDSRKVGQLLMVRVETFDYSQETERFVAAGVAGSVLMGRNGEISDAPGMLNYTNWLQSIAMAEGPPLLLAGDFEGGKLLIFDSLFSPWPNLMGLGATNSTGLARSYGLGYGTEIAALGFNMALAPVFDVNTNPANPVIANRALGSEPALVSRLGVEILAGYRQANIISTLKHFPGHGDTSVDSHTGLPMLKHNRSRLDSVELAPFAAAIAAGAPVVMTAHISVPALDPSGLPATLSQPILTGLLREELGFEGVIVTDALEMGAITTNYGTLEAARLALMAGSDLLLYAGGNAAQLWAYHGFLLDELETGNLTHERLNASILRILKLKLEYGLYERYPASPNNLSLIRSHEHRIAAEEMANRSATLVADAAGFLPLNPAHNNPLLIISPDNLLLPDSNLSLAHALALRGFNITQAIIEHDPNDTQREAVLTLANDSAVVILVTHNFYWRPHYYSGQLELAQALYELDVPVVLVSVENPYDLCRLPPFPTRTVAYYSAPVAIEAMTAALVGEIAFDGLLPVNLET